MPSPIIIELPENEWRKVATGITSGVVTTLNSDGGKLWRTYRIQGEISPIIAPGADGFEGIPFDERSYEIKSAHTIDQYIYSQGGTATVRVDIGIGGTDLVKQNSLLLNRPLSATGLPPAGAASASDVLIIPNASSGSPVDYYVEALPGECLACARAIIHTIAATNIGSGEYGDLTALTNGILLIYKRDGVTFNITDGLPIKINEHWGRWCYDSYPPTIGPTGNSPVWQSRWTFTKHGNPYGIVLEEGDRLGVRIQDNISGLTEQTIVIQGVHLGNQSRKWVITL